MLATGCWMLFQTTIGVILRFRYPASRSPHQFTIDNHFKQSETADIAMLFAVGVKVHLRIISLCTLRADAVAEFGIGTIIDISFNLFPVPFIIAYIFYSGNRWAKILSKFSLRQAGVVAGQSFPLFHLPKACPKHRPQPLTIVLFFQDGDALPENGKGPDPIPKIQCGDIDHVGIGFDLQWVPL